MYRRACWPAALRIWLLAPKPLYLETGGEQWRVSLTAGTRISRRPSTNQGDAERTLRYSYLTCGCAVVIVALSMLTSSGASVPATA